MTNQNNSFPKAILFDMDGVLIESQDAWWRAINVALTRSQYPPITKTDFVNNLWGNDFKKSVSYLGIDPAVFLECKEWTREYLKHVILKKDAISTLSKLQSKYKLAIITNTQRHITQQVLDQFQLKPFFRSIVCADDVKKGKPAPDIILKACEILQVSVSDVIVIGDTKSDLLACQQAGCQMIGMNFKNDGYSIHYLSELPKIISLLNRNG